MNGATCNLCMFGHSDGVPSGYVECRRYPPTVRIIVDPDTDMPSVTSQYPHADINRPCGEYQTSLDIASGAGEIQPPMMMYPNFSRAMQGHASQ